MQELGVDCPQWFDDLIMQLLEKDPEKRPFNARAVQGLIRDHLETEFGAEADQLIKNLPLPEHHPLTSGPGWGRIFIGLLAIAGLITAALLLNK